MGIQVSVLVDGIPPGGPITAELFPNLHAAVRAVAERAHAQWQEYAAGAPLPDGQTIKDRTGTYLRSIMLRETGDFSAEVYSELPYAQAIEEGTKQRDMKDMLRSSMKVRRTKDGRRYLIIPFRWNGPNSVLGNNTPVQVWNWWKHPDRVSSAITARTHRVSGTGAFDIATRQPLLVPAWRYRWGSRLSTSAIETLGFADNSQVAKRMAGMVRFRQPGKGGAAHSQLMTFRVMMEGSQGWIRPAQPGKWPARVTGDALKPAAEGAFAAGVEKDVAALLDGKED